MELEKQCYLDELAKLVNIDSVSSEPEGAGKIAAFMREKYESIGWSVEEVSLSESIAPCLKIVNKEAEHYDVLLLAHMDTVFPLGTAAKRPFRIEGSRAYGPGVIDCKGGMLSGYYALANLQARGALQEAAICVFLNSDHEGISSRYSAGYSTELAGKSRYVLVLEAGRANGNLVHKRKGIARYHIDIKGVAAHAGVDYQKGRNAVEELAHWIIALQAATDFTKETTVNVGKVWGGTGISAVPGAAGAAVDVRYYDKTEIERVAGVMDELQRHPHVEGTSAVVEGGITRPPMLPTEKTMALCRSIDEIGQEIGVEFGWTASGGGSDGSFAAAGGTPTIDGLGPVGGGAHSEGEYLEMDSIIPRYELLCRIIQHIICQR